MHQPIFIISPLNRSGTNFVARLLSNISELATPSEIHEDYFLAYSDLLEKYATQTRKHWGKELKTDSHSVQNEILEGFGASMISLANSRMESKKKLLLKCPRPYNLHNFFTLFPTAKVIICVRDGRDTVESFLRSFRHHNFKQVCGLWEKGCKEIDDFQKQYANTPFHKQILQIRYEDLYKQQVGTLKALTIFCDLGTNALTPDSIASLPLFGSSTNRGKSNHLHWDPVEKTNDFNPVGRWANWNWYQKWNFKKIAGASLLELHYEESHKW
jgi:protein-tyrosine sulfotransferase